MIEPITWWLTIEVIGAIAFPIAFVTLRFLPDRGYSLSKILGLLLVTYVLWLGANAHVIPNHRWSIILILALLVAVSGLIAFRRRRDIASFLRDRWLHLLALEVLFAAIFATALFLHSYSAVIDIAGSEKPTDNAVLNAIIRAEYFPPADPWLAGESVNYYYFGHTTVATLSKLTDVPSSTAFNLGLPLVLALAGIGIIGIVYNLLIERGRFVYVLFFAVLGALFFTVFSNLEGVFELLAAHGVGSTGFYDLLDINGLDGPRESSAWYPTEPYWWVRAYRYATGWEDNLFPFPRIQEGLLRPEIVVYPMLVLATGAALNLWRSLQAVGSARFWRWPVEMLIPVFALGSIAVSHTWNAPTFFLILVLAVALRNYSLGQRLDLTFALRTASFAVVLLLFAVIAFLPFYRSSFSAIEGIWLTDATAATEPHHFLYMWLPFFWLAGTLAVLSLASARPRLGLISLSVTPALLVFAAWVAMFIVDRGRPDLLNELTNRGGSWVTAFMLFAIFSTMIAGLLHLANSPGREAHRSPLLFGLALSAVAIAMLFALEFFFVKDVPSFPPRRDHAFRINMEAWLLFSIAGALVLHHAWTHWSGPRGLLQRLTRNGWAALTVVILLGGFVYPLLVTVSTTDTFAKERHLDGLFLMAQFEPGAHEAILWLRDDVPGTPVILEAVDLAYTPYSRVSSFTGLPTVLGWSHHEYWWRGSWDPQAGRYDAVESIYTTTNPDEAKRLMAVYEVEYVYVGRLEKEKYGEAGLSKFGSFMDVVLENSEVTIYRMPESQAQGAAFEAD